MEEKERVGTVTMKPFYALKRILEEYPLNTTIGGGVLKKFQHIVNKKVKELKLTKDEYKGKFTSKEAIIKEDKNSVSENEI